MSRYINADFFREILDDALVAFPNLVPSESQEPLQRNLSKARFETIQIVINILNSQPTADVREVVKGEWIDMGSGQVCSECHEIQYGYDNYRRYCPNCGADMRGEENECIDQGHGYTE